MNKVIGLMGVLTILALVVGPLAMPIPMDWGNVQGAAAQVAPGSSSLSLSPWSGPPGAVVQVEDEGERIKDEG